MENKDSNKKETDVTSLAEEAKKGAQIPSKEEMDAFFRRDFTAGLLTLEQILKTGVKSKKLSSRGLVRVLVALLQFPEPNLKVDVKPGAETTAFGIGQRVQIARFYLMMDQVRKDSKKRKEQEENKIEEKTEETNVKSEG